MGDFSAEQALSNGAKARTSASAPHPLALFFREFLNHPGMIGAIVPSSRRVIETMLSRVDWAHTKLFVEYGPGVGTFCADILDRLPPDGTLLVIDTNPVFIDYLRRKFTDSRFIAVNGSAAEVGSIVAEHGFSEADYVLSGLPFSTLPAGVGEAIADGTHKVLKPGGAFLVYQYSSYIVRLVEPLFERIDRKLEWLNIPPCMMHWIWKAADPA